MQQPGYQVQPQMVGGYPEQQQVVITMPVVVSHYLIKCSQLINK
jgi:hypothetical protein